MLHVKRAFFLKNNNTSVVKIFKYKISHLFQLVNKKSHSEKEILELQNAGIQPCWNRISFIFKNYETVVAGDMIRLKWKVRSFSEDPGQNSFSISDHWGFGSEPKKLVEFKLP